MEKCTSQCGEHTCQLEQGHKRKHADYGTDEVPCCVTWTDGGAERVNRELAEKAAKAAKAEKIS